jgi:cell division transport system permease protein
VSLDATDASISVRRMPLIPADTIAGRALVVVVAIMTFLACLTAGGAWLVADASRGWRSDVARDLTIQIKATGAEAIDALVDKVADAARAAPNVAEVKPFSRADAEKMLAPWLGQGLDLSQLPIPRLIVVHMAPGHENDVEPLRAAISAVSSEASLDDQRIWAARLDAMADGIVVFALVVLALMLVAMATAIVFATRGAVAATREIVEVLHFVGARDAFIAAEFQRHFRRLGFLAAMIGAGAAAALFALARLTSPAASASFGADQVASLLNAFALGPAGYGALLALGVFIGFATGELSRAIVLRQLRSFR